MDSIRRCQLAPTALFSKLGGATIRSSLATLTSSAVVFDARAETLTLVPIQRSRKSPFPFRRTSKLSKNVRTKRIQLGHTSNGCHPE